MVVPAGASYLPSMELAFSLLLGIGLSAATGLRIFIPALLASMAVHQGVVDPGEGFAWIGTYPAMITFGVATLVEVGAYYVPWVDNALDTIAGPGAVLAGGLIATSVIDIESDALRWILGMIAGGSSAGLVQTGTTLLRATSTATTGGLANPVVSTGEAVGAFSLAGLSILAPIIAVALLALLVAFGFRTWRRRRNRPKPGAPRYPDASRA